MVRLAKWTDVDFEARTLRIPNSNFKTKGRGDHTVYLSDEALSILTALPRDSELIFPSPRLKKALSDAAMGQVFSRLHQRSVNNGGKGWVDPVLSEKAGRPITATQHGTARASFKTWSKSGENRRLLDEEAVELCMAHKLKDDYGGAYNRATLEAERRAGCLGTVLLPENRLTDIKKEESFDSSMHQHAANLSPSSDFR